MISIIDIGLSNVSAVANMVKKAGSSATLIDNPEQLKSASKIILPGVGSFASACKKIIPFMEILNKKVIEEQIPLLGICLGMQMLCNNSEEGPGEGLGWIPGSFKLFTDINSKVPHMGWNTIKINSQSEVFKNLYSPSKFYFVHSYYLDSSNKYNAFTTNYNGFNFTSAILKDNILGVQLHPEKSHKYGEQLIKNFIKWQP